MYLVIENEEIIGFSTERETDQDIEINDNQADVNCWVKSGDTFTYKESLGEEISVRDKRNFLLLATDYTQLPDVPDTIRQAYTEYRQALRDITEQDGFPYNVAWPTKPEV